MRQKKISSKIKFNVYFLIILKNFGEGLWLSMKNKPYAPILLIYSILVFHILF